MRCNRKQLAKILGYDVKTVDRMVRDGMPCVNRPGDGQRAWVFDTADILRWMTGDDLADKNKASRSRLLQAKAGLKHLKYAEALGLLVHIDDIAPVWEEDVRIMKSRILAIPGRFDQAIAVESDPATIQKMLEDEIEEIFEQSERRSKSANEELAKRSAAAIRAARR